MKIKKAIYLFFLIIFASVLLASCQKKAEEIPSVFSNPSFGNLQSDIFFKKEQLKKLGLKGTVVSSVIVNENPQIAFLDINKQKITVITKDKNINRSPSFSPGKKKVFYASVTTSTSVIKVYDVEKKKETTLAAGKESRYDPVYFKDNKIIYNVFPAQGNFYLAQLDLKTLKEEKLNLYYNGRNFSERAAEPVYDPKTDTLYFVTDLATDGKPKPINIWAYNFKKGVAYQITKNTQVKIFEYNGQKIVSPQFFDLSLGKNNSLLYCVRFIDKHEEDTSPHITKIEAHILNLETNEDKIFAVENTQIRQPIQVTKDLIMLFYPQKKQVLLINYKKPHEKLVFLSLIDILGDADFE